MHIAPTHIAQEGRRGQVHVCVTGRGRFGAQTRRKERGGCTWDACRSMRPRRTFSRSRCCCLSLAPCRRDVTQQRRQSGARPAGLHLCPHRPPSGGCMHCGVLGAHLAVQLGVGRRTALMKDFFSDGKPRLRSRTL